MRETDKMIILWIIVAVGWVSSALVMFRDFTTGFIMELITCIGSFYLLCCFIQSECKNEKQPEGQEVCPECKTKTAYRFDRKTIWCEKCDKKFSVMVKAK